MASKIGQFAVTGLQFMVFRHGLLKKFDFKMVTRFPVLEACVSKQNTAATFNDLLEKKLRHGLLKKL
jgi:hypothetical protein